jgi:hypothetical protein
LSEYHSILEKKWKESESEWDKIPIDIGLMEVAEVAYDPLWFDVWFKARDREIYDGMYEHFLMVLRTAPADRVNTYMTTRDIK